MKNEWLIACAVVSGMALGGCGRPDTMIMADTGFRPTATIKDIMDAVVDPSADEIWESVATIVDADGVHEEFPRTDEEWNEVRRDTIQVIEATNLLLVPGRRVADPDVSSEFPEIELEPEQIQDLIDADPAKWQELAHGLHDMATETLAAIEARDVERLQATGQGLDIACERCHLNCWYPNDAEARRLFEENERFYLEGLRDSQ